MVVHLRFFKFGRCRTLTSSYELSGGIDKDSTKADIHNHEGIMKTIPALAFLFCSISLAHAQALQSQPQKPASEKPKQTQLIAPARPKPAADLLRQPVTYSGFLVDLVQTNNPRRLLSLRNPSDPKRDAQNISSDPVTGRVIGFKLFSIDF